MAARPETATLAEFAEIAGYKRSYVTQLKRDDRLVFDDSGRRLLVAESLARIDATRDPSKAGVAARHATERAAKAGEAPPASPPMSEEGTERIGATYQAARSVRERYLAMAAKRDYEISIGKLCEAAAVDAAAASAVTVLRTRLESLPDILGPQIAPITDEAAVRATLADEIAHTLEELAREFAALPNAGAAAND